MDDSQHVHGHSHGDGRFAAPASEKVRRILAVIVAPLMLATAIAMVLLWPNKPSDSPLAGPSANNLRSATVLQVDPKECTTALDQEVGNTLCDEVSIRLDDANAEETATPPTFEQSPFSGILLKRGDRIYVDRYDLTQADGSVDAQFGFYEFKRERPLIALAVVFLVVAVVIGRTKGIRAIIALGLSLAMLARFILPAIGEGKSPLLVALVGASAVMFVALYLSHGVNARTTSAIIGTLASLAITGLLASLAVSAARFTGLSDESAAYIRASSTGVDIRGLLLAGIVIGALGVLDDVTVTQSSAVWELHQADPTLSVRQLYTSALRIGRDHIASAVNTLVLAYAGASLPLLLLFTQVGTPLGEVLNGEPVATEIVRMLAGSVGLMASVPITTMLTALVVQADRHDG